jgi:hypothetical protein
MIVSVQCPWRRIWREFELTGVIEPVEQYLKTFSWNKVKYRADKPLAELIDLLQKVRGRYDG